MNCAKCQRPLMNCAKCQRPLMQVEFGTWAHVDRLTHGHVADPGDEWRAERAAAFTAMKERAMARDQAL